MSKSREKLSQVGGWYAKHEAAFILGAGVVVGLGLIVFYLPYFAMVEAANRGEDVSSREIFSPAYRLIPYVGMGLVGLAIFALITVLILRHRTKR